MDNRTRAVELERDNERLRLILEEKAKDLIETQNDVDRLKRIVGEYDDNYNAIATDLLNCRRQVESLKEQLDLVRRLNRIGG